MAPRRKIDKAALTKAEKVKFIQVGKLRDKKTDDSRNVYIKLFFVYLFADFGMEAKLYWKICTW